MSDGKPKVKLPVQSIICEDADPDHIPTWWGERVRLSMVSSYKSIDPIRRAPQRPLLQVPSHWSVEFQHKDLETEGTESEAFTQGGKLECSGLFCSGTRWQGKGDYVALS